MGIEQIAFTVLKILWETLEGLHLVHVAHIAGKASYKGGSHIKHAIQQRCQEWQDQKNPAQALEREAKTPYDFQNVDGNTTLKNINKQVEAYLVNLEASVGNLDKAKKYFIDIHSILTDITKDLESNDSGKCSSYLLRFGNNLERFKVKFKKFLASIEPPPRQLLYIASLDERKVIERYNSSLIDIKDYIKQLEEIEQEIANSAIIHARPRPLNNTELANIYSGITQACTKFQQIDITKLNDPFEGNSNWRPLLIEEKEIEEVGQRIFLHAMNEAENSNKEKELIAEIFLRKPISQPDMKEIEVEHLVYEMASKLRGWQIKKCDELFQFLSELKEGGALPKHDRDGLLAWLQTNGKKQNSLQLLKEILVEPCCFSQCSMKNESADSKLKKLLSAENSEKLIRQHLASHWGAIWEKNDTLIQLPKSFNAKISPTQQMKLDGALEKFNIVSAVMHKLAKAFMVDIQRLKAELAENKDFYAAKDANLLKKQTELYEAQKNQAHEFGVERIKKSQTRIPAINSLSSSLHPYLYSPETFNKEDKKRQVPTVDDLLQVIYLGVDPNGVCRWEPPYQTISQSNQLMYYFMPTQETKDSKTDAWLYAYKICQADRISVLSHLFFVPKISSVVIEKQKLVSDIAIKNSLSIQVIQNTSKGSNKALSINTNSKALRSVTPKMVQEIEVLFNQLQNYHVLALVRMESEYLSILPFMKRLKYGFNNLLKSDDAIGKERLASAKIYVSDLCAVLSEERVDVINKALADLEENYASRVKEANSKYNGDKSELYTIMEKLIKGPIDAIKKQMNAIAKQQKEEDAVGVNKEGSEEKETIQVGREETKKELKEASKETKAAQAREEAERKEKEAAQAREEAERKEKEAAQAEAECLRALLAEPAGQTPPQPSVASRVTFFSELAASQAANNTAENSILSEYKHAP